MRVAAWLRAWGLRIRRETRRQQDTKQRLFRAAPSGRVPGRGVCSEVEPPRRQGRQAEVGGLRAAGVPGGEPRRQQDTKQRLFRAAPSGRVPGRGVCSEVEPPRRQGRQAEVDGLRPAGRVPVGVCARRLNRQDAKDAKQRWMGFARRGAVQTGHMGDRSAKRPTDNRPAGHTPDRRSRAASLLRGLPVFVSPFCLASLAPWRLIPRAHAPTGTRPDGHTPRRAHAPTGTRPTGTRPAAGHTSDRRSPKQPLLRGLPVFVSPPLLGVLGALAVHARGTRPTAHAAPETRKRRHPREHRRHRGDVV